MGPAVPYRRKVLMSLRRFQSVPRTSAASREKLSPPLREVSQVSKNQVRQKADPDLPLDGVLAIADEVVNLAGLLELLEEGRDSPLSSC